MKQTLAILLCVLITACSRTEPRQTPEQRRRFEQLRQELRQTLGPKYDEPVPVAAPTQLKRGAELYAELCAGCHGARGDGQIEHPGLLLQQPSDFTDETQATFFSEQARLHIMRTGIRGTAMMGWAEVLPEADILAIYTYVRYLYKHE